MIIKSFEIDRNKIASTKVFLFYGENEGLKRELIEKIKSYFSGTIITYEETEILKNKEEFYNTINNGSLFDESKIITIERCGEKLSEIIFEIVEKKIDDVILLVNCGLLDRRSKLRSYFEKSKNTVVIPTYKDNTQSLLSITREFFNKKKISISTETMNLLINRCGNDRGNLKTELEKISNYLINKKVISLKEIYALTNLIENYSAAELVDASLSKNKKKTCEILNENNYLPEDCFLILRIFLQKSKKILNILEIIKSEKDIDKTLDLIKPPIFWKDKPIIKKHLQIWSIDKIKEVIYKINIIEVCIKKNNSLAVILMRNFFFEMVDEKISNSA